MEKDIPLSPLFRAQSTSGIGLPHAGHEVELMIAGVKPCLITGWPLTAHKGQEDYTKLQPLIDSGQIIVAGIQEITFPKHIICRPEDVEAAKKQAALEYKVSNYIVLSIDELNDYYDFWPKYYGIKIENNAPSVEDFNKRSQNSHLEPERLLKGEIRMTLPVMTGTDNSFRAIPRALADKISSGELCAVPVTSHTQSMAVLALRDCLDMGKELFARYYKNDEGYEPLSNEEWNHRVGELLGYTKADTDYFLRQEPQSKSGKKRAKLDDALQKCLEPLLRDMRADKLIYDAYQERNSIEPK